MELIRETIRKKGHGYAIYRCECGNEKEIRIEHVRTGRVKRCGCKSASQTHGHSYSGAYGTWTNMKARCLRETSDVYSGYGGRGIKVCERWMSFENFLEDMGERPEEKTLDRIDNDGNYCKENCRWATKSEQMNNRSNSRFLEYKGEVKTMRDWAVSIGMDYNKLNSRINTLKWSVERALVN